MQIRVKPSLLAAAAALLPLTVLGQEMTLEEIVVTAQKRTQNAVDVPISMTLVSGDGLEAGGVGDMGSLSQLVPGLHIDSSGAFFQPSIRGVGTAISGAGASANVATYVDGIYKPNALSNDFDFVDVESIQVLKGPQGTLFGRNATGGAILVTTRQPSADPELEVKAGYGSFNTIKGSLFGTTGTDKFAVSLAAGYTESDGWMEFADGGDANPSESYTARLKFKFAPTDDWTITLAADVGRQDDPSLYAVNAFNGFSSANSFFGTPVITDDSRKVSLGTEIVHIAEGYGFDLKVEGDLGFATLTSYSAWHDDEGEEATVQTASNFPPNGALPIVPCGASNGFCTIITAARWDYTQETYSQEFNLAHSGEGALDWVVGLFFFRDRTEYDPFTISLFGPLGPGGLFVNSGYLHASTFGTTARSVAVFADATYDLGSLTSALQDFSFTAGGRYAEDTADVFWDGFFPAPSDVPSAEENFYSFTPRAVLKYAIDQDSNVYFSWSQGEKAGLFNASGFNLQPDPVQPEEITAYELGYKISKPTWQLEASVFSYDYTDLQVATYIGAAAFFQNTEKASIYGADLHWQQLVTDRLTLDIGFAYTNAEYDEFPNAAIQTFNPLLGVVNGTGDVSGGNMQRTPEYSGTLGLTYSVPLLSGTLDLTGVYNYQDEVSFDFAGTLTQEAVSLVNLRAAWTDPSDKWTLALSGKNVTDEEYLVQVLPNAGGFGQAWAAPASVMAELGYRF